MSDRDIVVPGGERCFVLGSGGREQIIVSVLDASIDALGPSVICDVKAFDVSIESAVFMLNEIGIDFRELPGPGGAAYLNSDQFRGNNALITVLQFIEGNRIGTSMMIAQQK